MTEQHAPRRRRAKAIAIARSEAADQARLFLLAAGLAASLAGVALWLIRF